MAAFRPKLRELDRLGVAKCLDADPGSGAFLSSKDACSKGINNWIGYEANAMFLLLSTSHGDLYVLWVKSVIVQRHCQMESSCVQT